MGKISKGVAWTVQASITNHGESKLRIEDRNGDAVSVTFDHGAELDSQDICVQTWFPFRHGMDRVGLIANASAREFMGGLGFLPDPGESGTWYEDGACCRVPEWVEVGPLRIRRDEHELIAAVRADLGIWGGSRGWGKSTLARDILDGIQRGTVVP